MAKLVKKAIPKQLDPVSISESAGASFCEGLEDVFINPTVRNMSQNTVLFDSIIAEVSDETEKLEQDNGYYFSYYMKFHMQCKHLLPFLPALLFEADNNQGKKELLQRRRYFKSYSI